MNTTSWHPSFPIVMGLRDSIAGNSALYFISQYVSYLSALGHWLTFCLWFSFSLSDLVLESKLLVLESGISRVLEMIGTWPLGFICFWLFVRRVSLPLLPPFLPFSALATSQATQDTPGYDHFLWLSPGFLLLHGLGCSHFMMLPQLTHPLSGCWLSDSLSCLQLLRSIFLSLLALRFSFVFYSFVTSPFS